MQTVHKVLNKWLSYRSPVSERAWIRLNWCHCPFKNTWFSLEEQNKKIGAAKVVDLCAAENLPGGRKEEPTGQIGSGRGLVPALRSVLLEATRWDGQKLLRQSASSPTHRLKTCRNNHFTETDFYLKQAFIKRVFSCCHVTVPSQLLFYWIQMLLINCNQFCFAVLFHYWVLTQLNTVSCKIVSHLKASSASCGII